MGAHTSPIQDVNVLFVAFLGVLCVYVGRHYIANFIRTRPAFRGKLRPLLAHRIFRGQLPIRLFRLALIVLGGTGAFLELYYYSWCPVSRSYYQTNLMLAREIIKNLNHIGVAYWPDFATLLNVVRHEEVNAWEHDVDFSMLHPGEDKLEHILTLLRKNPKLEVAYFPDRGLIQLWAKSNGGPYGPHADIFLWNEMAGDGRIQEEGFANRANKKEPWITNSDYTLRITKRRWNEMFPLKTGSWLGLNVTIPRDPHSLCLAEYGEGYTSPRLYRLDCLENILHLRFFPVAEP